MITITREQLKDVPELFQVIKNSHTVDTELVIKELFKDDEPQLGIVYQRGYFAIVKLLNAPAYLHYVIDHEIKITTDAFAAVAVSVDSVTLFESYTEYEAERFKTLSTSKDVKGFSMN
jgi:hypothetical protein